MKAVSDYHKYCLRDTDSLHRALEVIDRGGAGIALLVDEPGRLLGTLTDGDVRRAILKGAALADPARPFAHTECITVPPEASRAEVLDVMQSLALDQVPIVDGERRLLGLHLLHDMLGRLERPNTAVIMAGGRGSRLGALTESTPKPLLKVAGRPILERLVHHLVGYGLRNIFISVHYLSHMIEDHFGDGSRFGCRIGYLRETEPLGTGGCLKILPAAPVDPVLVCNGDLITQVNVDHFFKLHEQGGHEITMGVKTYAHHIPFGCAEVENGRLVSLVEKPTILQLVNTGMYILSPGVIAAAPEAAFPITDLIGECLKNRKPVGVFEVMDDWIDVGSHDQLKLARGT